MTRLLALLRRWFTADDGEAVRQRIARDYEAFFGPGHDNARDA
jgi:hypothetical protein